ncbi:hypothetical protein F0562_007121 [Nyssa sinensis]|uniref:Uncharacterized protein n=1 Tax=Nyssa sinensis TaxID=561372 RepID=A0A5J5A5G2_9ASTE|nr:hypothetical protein F0562_007121 [Nyssa sinensis]
MVDLSVFQMKPDDHPIVDYDVLSSPDHAMADDSFVPATYDEQEKRATEMAQGVTARFAISLHCDIPGSNDRMLVESDTDLLKMFDRHSGRKINIYVDTMSSTNAIPLVPSSSPNPLGTTDDSKPMTVSSETTEDEGSDIDDVYGFTSKDEVGVENLGSFKFHDFNPGVNVEVHSGDGLSDFESDDNIEYNPSSKSSNSDEDSVGKSTSKVFEQNLYGKEYHVSEGDKIVLKLGQLFENVDTFREVMRDFTNQ